MTDFAWSRQLTEEASSAREMVCCALVMARVAPGSRENEVCSMKIGRFSNCNDGRGVQVRECGRGNCLQQPKIQSSNEAFQNAHREPEQRFAEFSLSKLPGPDHTIPDYSSVAIQQDGDYRALAHQYINLTKS